MHRSQVATDRRPGAGLGSPPGYARGLRTLANELTLGSLRVDGTIPSWLRGTYVGNGPGRFDVARGSVRHWFDGLAMLHAFSFDAGRVGYRNRYLRSEAFRRAEQGDVSFGAFATVSARTAIGRMKDAFPPPGSDNCGLAVAPLGGGCVAFGESPLPVCFSERSLEVLDVPYLPPGHRLVPHGHHEPRTGELVGCGIDVGRRSGYRIFVQSGRERQRIVAELPAAEPSYVHSFALTERYVVLTACPYVVSPVELSVSALPYARSFRWEPERGTVIFLLDRRSGELRGRFETEAFFALHHVNAFERDGEVAVDLVAYDDPGVIDALYLDRLRAAPPPESATGSLRRYRLDGSGGVTRLDLCREPVEFPQIDYAGRNGREHRYVYAVGSGGMRNGAAADFNDRLLKIDTADGSARTWREPGCYPGEPLFVRGPGAGGEEDDGVLLSVVLDGSGSVSGSYLLVLDAATFEELGRAVVPHHVPLGLHGHFFAAAGGRP